MKDTLGTMVGREDTPVYAPPVPWWSYYPRVYIPPTLPGYTKLTHGPQHRCTARMGRTELTALEHKVAEVTFRVSYLPCYRCSLLPTSVLLFVVVYVRDGSLRALRWESATQR